MVKSTMNLLAIDYGTKRIGLAISIKGIISPLKTIPNNDHQFSVIKKVISDYQISKVYIGLSEGYFAKVTKKFINQLQKITKIPIETVEESISTIEAEAIFKRNKNKSKNYQKKIDSLAAAVILSRTQV